MNNLLLIADILLPISSKPIYNGAIAVSNGLITDIGNVIEVEKKYPNSTKMLKNNCVILPGFINAHTHLELGWIKNKMGGFNDFIQWLQQIILAKMENIDERTIKKSVEKGIKDLIRCGVTTVGEISSYNGIDKEILKNSGIRTILFTEIFDRNINQIKFKNFVNNLIYEERPFPHSPYSCSPETLRKVFKFSKKENLPLSIHLAESQDEVNFLKNLPNGFESKIFPLLKKNSFSRESSESPTSYISKFNIDKNSQLTAVHAVQLNKNDVDIIKNKNIGIVLCPRSNLILKIGKPKFKLLRGLENIGIGTDGLSSNYDLNFMQELRVVNNILVESNIENNTFRTVYYGTLGGAKALFLDGKIGSIEAGKEADLICFNYGDQKPKDPYLSVLNSDFDDLEFSIVRGKFIYKKN